MMIHLMSNWTDKFSLTPFYRFYFFNKKDFGGSGFFSEIFSKFGFGKHDVEYYNYNPDNDSPGIDYWEVVEEDYFDIALVLQLETNGSIKKVGHLKLVLELVGFY